MVGEEWKWIDGSAISSNLEVAVRAGRVARLPDTGDHLTLLHSLATFYEMYGIMSIE